MGFSVNGAPWPPIDGGGMPLDGDHYDAGGHRVADVGAATAPADAVTLAQLEARAGRAWSLSTQDATPTPVVTLSLAPGEAVALRVEARGTGPAGSAIAIERHALAAAALGGAVSVHQGDTWAPDPIGGGWVVIPGPDGSTHLRVTGGPAGALTVSVVGLMVDPVAWDVRVTTL